MPKNLYVGNLPYSVTSEELHDLFDAVGELKSAHVVTDRESGRSKGFGFVLFVAEEDGDTALEKYDGEELHGRTMIVKPAINKARRDYRN
jgi:RNA recognition motif-containing protein